MRPAVPVVIAILALFLASSSLPPALAQTVTEPILIVDITETEMRVNSSYSKPMTVTYNGTAEMVKPIYMVGDITVTLSAVVGTGYQASVEPSAMTFTKSETQLFVIRILLPAGLTDNMTMVNLTAVAESIVGRSVKEDSAVLILEHDNSCEDGTDCRDDGDGDGNDGNDQANALSIWMTLSMCLAAVGIAAIVMVIAYLTKRKGSLDGILGKKSVKWRRTVKEEVEEKEEKKEEVAKEYTDEDDGEEVETGEGEDDGEEGGREEGDNDREEEEEEKVEVRG